MADENKDTKDTVVVEKDGKNNTAIIVVLVIVVLLALFWIFGNPFGGSNTNGGNTDVNEVNVGDQTQ